MIVASTGQPEYIEAPLFYDEEEDPPYPASSVSPWRNILNHPWLRSRLRPLLPKLAGPVVQSKRPGEGNQL